MPFITQSNFNRIIGQIRTDEDLEGEVYKTRILFFNKTEKNRLLKIKQILQLGDSAFTKIFIKIEREDTQSWIFEGGQPAHHATGDCPTLHSEYVNFPIPEKIKEENQVKEFREWFKENNNLLENGSKKSERLFMIKMLLKFGVTIRVVATG